MALLYTQLRQRICYKERTLVCDGWNNKKPNYLVVFILMVDSIPHPTRTFDNLRVKRDGAPEEKAHLEELFGKPYDNDIFYTDGSQMGNSIGAAVIHRATSQKWNLGSKVDNYDAFFLFLHFCMQPRAMTTMNK